MVGTAESIRLKAMRASIALFLLLALILMTLPCASADMRQPPKTRSRFPEVALGQTTPSGLSFAEMEEQIDAVMGEHIGNTTPGAAIVVVQDGEILFSRGYGWADVENQVPVDPAKTVFEYGSINKTFIWVAVMQLVEQGLLDLDADIQTYLPASFVFEYPFTMRDVLNHAAGFEDIALGLLLDASDTPVSEKTLEEALLASKPRQVYAPGEVSSYSNWGAGLAALVVERISGQPYYVYERENILLPSNMRNTLNQPDWHGNLGFLADKAQGYESTGDGGFSRRFWSYIPFCYPSGAANGTAEDLAAYIKALTPPVGEPSPLFVSAETLSSLFTPSSPDPENRPGTYHGFARYNGVVPAFGHGGGTVAFRTNFAICPQTRFGYALLINSTNDDVLLEIRELLLGYSKNEVGIGTGGLPNAAEVEGLYITARRTDGIFLELVPYLLYPILQVTATGENTILLHRGSEAYANYTQVTPYVYRVVSASEGVSLHEHHAEIRFRLEGGVPVQILVGHGSDYTALPPGRTMPFLVASFIIALIAVAFFLITPPVLLFIFLIHRKKQRVRTRFDRFSLGLLLSGSLLTLNNIALLLRMSIQNYRTAAEIAPHIWINYVLAGLAAIMLACSIWTWLKESKALVRRKAFFIATAVIEVLFVAVLQNWHFFALF